MKVAVTGATGFVGRHAVTALLARGAEVVAAARAPERLGIANERLTTVALDIGQADDPFARLGNPDVMLHLAWGGLPNYRSQAHIENELPRQIAFLDACARGGLQRLVVTGTCLEYGMQSGRLDEELPTAATTVYGQAKDRLREHLQTLASAGGPQLTWLRLFYLYGPGQAPTSLYSQLRAAIAAGASEFPMSPGNQQRDFLPIETAAAHIGALALNAPGAGIVNLCSGVPKAVAALVREWLRDWGAELRLNLGVYPYPDYEPMDFWGSTRKLDALLGTT
jgi:dTDP-6-deoxy-L-talose 4-dehydrogenase (NAD+)